jgi:hypothetical protein
MKSKLPYSERGRTLGQYFSDFGSWQLGSEVSPLQSGCGTNRKGTRATRNSQTIDLFPSATRPLFRAVWVRHRERAYLTVLGEEVRR